MFSLAGMAELHPEECRSRLYRVGQRRQVGNSDLLNVVLSPCSGTSSLSFEPLSNFTIPGSRHSLSGTADPQGPCDGVAI